MKLVLFIFVSISLILATKIQVKVSLKSKISHKLSKTQGDTIGEAYNSEDKPDSVAVSYAIASDGGNNLQDLNGYKKPQMVEKLPDVILPPAPGPVESTEEIPSITTYYDGSLNLNVAVVDCHIISAPNECFKSTTCGWCGANNSCVKGTANSPVEPCQNGYNFNGATVQQPLVQQ